MALGKSNNIGGATSDPSVLAGGGSEGAAPDGMLVEGSACWRRSACDGSSGAVRGLIISAAAKLRLTAIVLASCGVFVIRSALFGGVDGLLDGLSACGVGGVSLMSEPTASPAALSVSLHFAS